MHRLAMTHLLQSRGQDHLERREVMTVATQFKKKKCFITINGTRTKKDLLKE